MNREQTAQRLVDILRKRLADSLRLPDEDRCKSPEQIQNEILRTLSLLPREEDPQEDVTP